MTPLERTLMLSAMIGLVSAGAVIGMVLTAVDYEMVLTEFGHIDCPLPGDAGYRGSDELASCPYDGLGPLEASLIGGVKAGIAVGVTAALMAGMIKLGNSIVLEIRSRRRQAEPGSRRGARMPLVARELLGATGFAMLIGIVIASLVVSLPWLPPPVVGLAWLCDGFGGTEVLRPTRLGSGCELGSRLVILVWASWVLLVAVPVWGATCIAIGIGQLLLRLRERSRIGPWSAEANPAGASDGCWCCGSGMGERRDRAAS